jgi:hypothetical protein
MSTYFHLGLQLIVAFTMIFSNLPENNSLRN